MPQATLITFLACPAVTICKNSSSQMIWVLISSCFGEHSWLEVHKNMFYYCCKKKEKKKPEEKWFAFAHWGALVCYYILCNDN